MKVGDFVKVDPKYMSPLTARRYNNNPMGLVTWTWGASGTFGKTWAKVMLTDGRELSFPAQCMEVINDK